MIELSMQWWTVIGIMSLVGFLLLFSLGAFKTPETHEQRVERIRLDALARHDAKVKK